MCNVYGLSYYVAGTTIAMSNSYFAQGCAETILTVAIP